MLPVMRVGLISIGAIDCLETRLWGSTDVCINISFSYRGVPCVHLGSARHPSA